MRLERSAERDKRKNKNNPSADDAQSTAEGILNRFCLPEKAVCGETADGLFRSSTLQFVQL